VIRVEAAKVIAQEAANLIAEGAAKVIAPIGPAAHHDERRGRPN
jgi:hypothetical protein